MRAEADTTDVPLTIVYSGTVADTEIPANRRDYGPTVTSVSWKLRFSGLLSAAQRQSPPRFQTQRVSGSYAQTYPAPHQGDNCTYRLGAGKRNVFTATLTGTTLTVSVAVPSTAFDLAVGGKAEDAEIVARRTSKADCSLLGGLPTRGDWTTSPNPAQPRVTIKVGVAARTWALNARRTYYEGPADLADRNKHIYRLSSKLSVCTDRPRPGGPCA